MSDRYFVDILVPDRKTLQRIHGHGFDIFRHTVGGRAGGFAVSGFLTLEEVARLVDDGCQVTVKQREGQCARAHEETATFDVWLDAMSRD